MLRSSMLTTVAVVLASWPAVAGDFDGSEPLLCAAMRVTECPLEAPCEQVLGESVGVPSFWRIDVAAATVTATGADPRQSAIKNVDHIDGKLIIQGAEDGIEGVRDGAAWSAAIDEETGRMVVTAAGDGVGFVVFGACTLP